jgi:hypothetical protein
MNEVRIFGLAWWQPEQWSRLKQVSEDSDRLDDTYEEWRKGAHEAIRVMQSQGQIVKKVKINLDKFITWCDEKNIPVNGAARAEYAAYLLEHGKH